MERIRVHLLVRVDHKEASIAKVEGVIVLGIGKGYVIVVVFRILFVVTEHGIERDVIDQRTHTWKEMLEPVLPVLSCGNQISGMKEKARALSPGKLGNLLRHLRIPLGIADDGKSIGGLSLHRRLEGSRLAQIGSTRGSPRFHTIEILGLRFKALENDFMDDGSVALDALIAGVGRAIALTTEEASKLVCHMTVMEVWVANCR